MLADRSLPILGLEVAKARAELDDLGLLHRIVSVDGRGQAVSSDARSNRVGLVLAGGIVAGFEPG